MVSYCSRSLTQNTLSRPDYVYTGYIAPYGFNFWLRLPIFYIPTYFSVVKMLPYCLFPYILEVFNSWGPHSVFNKFFAKTHGAYQPTGAGHHLFIFSISKLDVPLTEQVNFPFFKTTVVSLTFIVELSMFLRCGERRSILASLAV